MKPKSFYSIFSITSLLLLSICACNSPNEKQQENKPLNVIYIMADDHAYQAVSAYGSQVSKLAPTPNIDRIANEGARMDAVYCTNSICGPSRASILTVNFHMSMDSIKMLMDEILMVNNLHFQKFSKKWL